MSNPVNSNLHTTDLTNCRFDEIILEDLLRSPPTHLIQQIANQTISGATSSMSDADSAIIQLAEDASSQEDFDCLKAELNSKKNISKEAINVIFDSSIELGRASIISTLLSSKRRLDISAEQINDSLLMAKENNYFEIIREILNSSKIQEIKPELISDLFTFCVENNNDSIAILILDSIKNDSVEDEKLIDFLEKNRENICSLTYILNSKKTRNTNEQSIKDFIEKFENKNTLIVLICSIAIWLPKLANQLLKSKILSVFEHENPETSREELFKTYCNKLAQNATNPDVLKGRLRYMLIEEGDFDLLTALFSSNLFPLQPPSPQPAARSLNRNIVPAAPIPLQELAPRNDGGFLRRNPEPVLSPFAAEIRQTAKELAAQANSNLPAGSSSIQRPIPLRVKRPLPPIPPFADSRLSKREKED